MCVGVDPNVWLLEEIANVSTTPINVTKLDGAINRTFANAGLLHDVIKVRACCSEASPAACALLGTTRAPSPGRCVAVASTLLVRARGAAGLALLLPRPARLARPAGVVQQLHARRRRHRAGEAREPH